MRFWKCSSEAHNKKNTGGARAECKMPFVDEWMKKFSEEKSVQAICCYVFIESPSEVQVELFR